MAPLARYFPFAALIGLLTALLILPVGCGDPDEKDTTPPFVRITFPEEFTVLSDIATIRLDTRDNVGIKQVTLIAEGDTLARLLAEPYTFYWNTTAYPDCTAADPYVVLTAAAKDFAGNNGSTDRKFCLNNEGLPPIPVELSAPTNVTKHSAELSWEQSVDYDFSHYILRRDTTSEVISTSDSLVSIDDLQTTQFADSGQGVSSFGLLEDTDYYYRVFVHDEFGRSTGSDSVAAVHTLLPQPVRLRATALITKYIAGLEWELSSEDVAYYRLHRGFSSQQADLDSIAGFSRDTRSYIDSSLAANTAYYYYLYLVDEAGHTHLFRDADVLELWTLALPSPILEDPPPPVTKYTAVIAWQTITEQEDSSWVALYRSTSATVDSNDVLVYTGPLNEVHTYTDSPLQQGRTYRYRMRHRDSRDNIAWSNTLALTTTSLADIWSGGLGISQQGKYELQLTWDRYSYSPAVDFAGYTLSRDGQVIFTSANAAENRRTDRGENGLAKNTLYHYRLEVADTSGATVAATLEASTRDIFPAEIVRLEPTVDWFYDLAWLPSREPDSEFDRYELLRSNDTRETFEDKTGDDMADCLLSGNCVQVEIFTERQPADTITYQDDDATLVATTLIDTILMIPIQVDTTLMDTTWVDTTLMDTTWVDTIMVITPVDTILIDTTWVDTTLILIIPVDTTLVDTTLPIFNYVVLTYDLAGEYVRSNIVGDTLYAPPTPVTLSVPCPGCWQETIGLEWIPAEWPSPVLGALLFSRYEVWRNSASGQQPGAEGSSYQMIAFINDINETSYSDGQNLGQQRDWFYVVVVRDIFGQGAVSNEVKGWTKL